MSGVAERLPHGRHGLTREEVEASQLGRMLAAMADAVAECGYASTPVSEVLRRARVSRETFYEHFENKEACFLAAYEGAAGIVLAGLAEAGETPEDDNDVLSRILERYLATLAAEPAVAQTFMVEVYAAGDAARGRRVAIQERFTEQVIAWTDARTDDERFACETVVAAITGLVTNWICAGRTDRLPELHAPLMRQINSILEGRPNVP